MLSARNLSIGERVYVATEDYQQAVGKIVSIGDKKSGMVHFSGDELNVNVAVVLERDCEDVGAAGEVCNFNNQDIYKIARDRYFQGEDVCYEHHTDIEYPYYCPAFDENCYAIETALLRNHDTKDEHRIIDTCDGEVMLRQTYDCDTNSDTIDAYIGDNYDDYIGTIYGNIQTDSDEVLEERLKEGGML